MAIDPQFETRLKRLENDRDATYELLTEISATQHLHSVHFAEIDVRLDAIDVRLDGIDVRLGGIGTTLVEVLRRLPEPV